MQEIDFNELTQNKALWESEGALLGGLKSLGERCASIDAQIASLLAQKKEVVERSRFVGKQLNKVRAGSAQAKDEKSGSALEACEMTVASISYQKESAITVCEARISNGADATEAFNWLRDELERIENGEVVYKD